MKSFYAKADAQMSRKYGPDAWLTMARWGQVRNRLEQAMYDRHLRRMMWLVPVVPAIVVSVLVPLVAALLRA